MTSSPDPPRFRSEELGDDHRLEAFVCGQVMLDTWLRRSARHAQAMRTARTFVWQREGGVVVAYFSLAAHLVARADLPPRVGRGSPDAIPAVMLARLALHRDLHGRGLGGELLWDALSRAVAASRLAAARVVVVDAVDERAAAFYEHHGFIRAPGVPHRLVQKTGDVVAALEP